MEKFSLKTFFLVFLVSLFLPISVLAKEKINLNVDKTTLEIGEEVIVRATLAENNKIYSAMATLNYDEKVFEKIDDTNFTLNSQITDIVYNEKNNKFGIVNASGMLPTELFEVRLKVKNDANVGNTNIALTNISVSDGQKKDNYEQTVVKVLITKDAVDGEALPNNQENEIVAQPAEVIKTFSTVPIIINLGIIVTVLIAITIYFYIKRRDNIKIIIGLTTGSAILLITIAVLCLINNGKHDVNNDGHKDYNDAKEIIKYLIDIEGKEDTSADKKPNSNHKFNYDVNNDGKVDINDAASSTEHTTQEMHYTVKLTNKDQNQYYVNKGQITLNMEAIVKPNNFKIAEIFIDGKYYKAIRNASFYSVLVDTPQTPGVHEYKITKVKLENGREIATKLNITKEILKDRPYVDLFNVDDEENILSFKLEDKDQAFKKGEVVIYDEKGEEVSRTKISSNNQIKYDFVKEKTYNIVVLATYDLDSDALNKTTGKQENLYTDEVIYNHNLIVSGNYNFAIKDVKISDAIEKNSHPVIRFTSTNNKKYPVEYVVINGIQYKVSLIDDDTYEVVLESFDTTKTGKFTLNIEEVTLNNLKAFYNNKDYEINPLTFNVLKNAPTIKDINLKNDADKESINVTYKITDKDQTLNKLVAVLSDSTGKKVAEEEIDLTKLNDAFTLSYAQNSDGRYQVKFLADYNLGTDRHDYTNKNIGEEEILTQTEVVVVNAEVVNNNNIFPKKGQPKYTIKYTIDVSDNVKKSFSEFAGVTINGVNYDGSCDGINKTTISFTVPSESGVVDLTVNRVKLRKESYNGLSQAFYSVANYVTKIDVLKDDPTISDLTIVSEDYDQKEATFKFKVVDDKGGFIKGTVELNGDVKPIHIGSNEVTFTNITPDKDFALYFKGTYDLDTNTLDSIDNQNRIEDKTFYAVPYGLYNDDLFININLENARLVSNNANDYFEKNEDIRAVFAITGLPENINLFPQKVVINNKAYEIKKVDDLYLLTLNGYSNAGRKEIVITDLVFTNGKKIKLTNNVVLKPEILKDEVTLKDYSYEIKENNIKINLVLKDEDKALINNSAKVRILTETGTLKQELPYDSEIILAKEANVLRYNIQLLVDYDRDINQQINTANYYQNVKLLDEIISLDKNFIELKDITNVTLFKNEGNNIVSVKNINVADLTANLKDYFVEIVMHNMPTVRSKIKGVTTEGDHLILILDYENVINGNAVKKENVRIDLGPIVNGMVQNEAQAETFAELINRIKANPNGNIVLKNDYDASSVELNSIAAIDLDFTGTLDGNGHTIKNLNCPLFNTISNGQVKNLNLENINITISNANGSLANEIRNTVVKNVLVNGFNKTSNNDKSGGLVGSAIRNSVIENSRVINLYLAAGGTQQNGGLVGFTDNAKISNCYVIGTVTGSWNYIGGLVGNAVNSEFNNNIVKVNVTGHVSCGLACTYTTASRYSNNITLSTGANTIFADKYAKMDNNYALATGESNIPGLTYISQDAVNTTLFKNDLKFSEEIWKLKNVSFTNLPKFVIEKTSKINVSEVEDEYDEDKEILYNNLIKLMPFYDSKKIINSAKVISADSSIAKKEIKHLVPLDATGNVVTYLTTNDVKKITKLAIIFDDGETLKYDVRFDNSYDMVASYRISALQLDYTYNHYVIDANSQLVNNLTNYLESLTYEDNLDILTPSLDSRIYRDYYNDVTKKELKEFVLKYLANSNYTNTNNDEVINNHLEKEIKSDKKLEKLLYVYNYFRRFYSVSVEGLMLNDFILFDFQDFDESLTPEEIAKLFLANESNFQTSRTSNVFASTLGKYTNHQNIIQFLEYIVPKFSNKKVAQWYKDEFKGYIVEIPVSGHPEVQYTLWDHLRTPDKNTKIEWYNYALPILTLPKNAAYIISSPVQFVIGAQRTYIIDPENPIDQAKLQRKIASYADRMGTYYDTAFKIVNDVDVFNNIHTIQIDKRYAYDQNGMLMFQNPNSTEEPFHKNFNEVIGQWAYNDYNAATANGAFVIWRVEGLMDGNIIPADGDVYEYTFHTWSHETAHNIDARLFLKDYGRRFDAGGEDYADGNLTQSFGEGDIVMNLSRHFAPGSRIAVNLDPSRIDTPKEIHDFYNKLFQVVYIMDYIEGKAFLQLDPADQAKLAVQVSYPNADRFPIGSDKPYYQNYLNTVYQEISEQKIRDMHLTKIDDLYDNQLVMYPGIIYSTITSNRYGGENIFKVRWYQPHNDYGRPDSYSLKWLAYEMLGYAGYENGYIEYYSNIHSDPTERQFYNVTETGDYALDDKGQKKGYTVTNYKTDLMAIKRITKYDSVEAYKKARFKEVEDKLELINYIDVDSLISRFVEALKSDAQTVRDIEAQAQIKYPGTDKTATDNRNKMISNDGKQFKNSTALRKEIYYTIKDKTNDFIGDVYAKDKSQVIK